MQSATAETGSISTTVTGTGNLGAAETIDVVTLTGIEIDEVLVESGDTVIEGQVLATVKKASVASALIEVEESLESVEDELDSSSLSDLEEVTLNAEYEDLTEAHTKLTELYESLEIKATTDGIIENVNVSADTEVTKSSGSSSSNGSFVSSAVGSLMQVSTAAAVSAAEIVSDFTNLVIEAPVTGEKPVTAIATDETKEQGYEVSSITWNCVTEVFQADTVYTAIVTLQALEGYRFDSAFMPSMGGASYEWNISGTDAQNTMTLTVTYAATAAESSAENDNSNTNIDSKNDTDSNNNTGNISQSQSDAGAEQYTSDAVAGTASGSASKSSAASASGSSANGSSVSGFSASADIYSAYETAAFTIISQENVKISLSVDELDILSVEEGQTAVVTLDALENQQFEGTITKVNTFGSSSGSSAKYTVEITIPKDEKMLIGMSASATINIDEAEDAVLIPIAALQERGGSTFVYTEKDADGNLSGEVEVETGLSNGSQVEIISGLEVGDTVYYLKTESSSGSSMGDFGGGMQMPSGGDMPSGMEMPSGGDMPSGGSGGGRSGGGQMPGSN